MTIRSLRIVLALVVVTFCSGWDSNQGGSSGGGGVSGLTAGRVPFAASSSSLADNANVTFDGRDLVVTFLTAEELFMPSLEQDPPVGFPSGAFLAQIIAGRISTSSAFVDAGTGLMHASVSSGPLLTANNIGSLVPADAGSATIPGASTSLEVTLPREVADATYHVSLTSVDSSAGLPADIRVTARTTTTFTLTYVAAAEDINITYKVFDF